MIWLWCSGLRGPPETWTAGGILCRQSPQNRFVAAYEVCGGNRGLNLYLSHFKYKRKAPEAWCWELGDPHWGCGLKFSSHLADVELSSGFGPGHYDARCYRVALMVFLRNNCRTIHPNSNYIINKKRRKKQITVWLNTWKQHRTDSRRNPSVSWHDVIARECSMMRSLQERHHMPNGRNMHGTH